MEKAERCEQALHVYGPPFRHGKEKEKERERGRAGRGMGVVVECTAGCLGAGGGGKGEDASNTMYRETSRLYSRDDQDEEDGVRMDEMEAEAGDTGVADPGAGDAGCSYCDHHEGEGSRRSVVALHPLEIKDGSPVATSKASTSDHSDGTVDVVVQGSPPQLHQARSVSQPSSAKLLKLSPTLEYISALAHLTTFGILGVCIRYGLEILYYGILNVTADDSPLFIDLPANMVGCFFMGWVGVVLKKDIAMFSELLAIGLSTGLMGSITTYASWNQQMLAMITKGLWVRSLVGLLIGLQLSQMSLTVGMDSAKLLQYSLSQMRQVCARRGSQRFSGCSADNIHRRRIGMLVFLATSFVLWVGAIVLTVVDTDSVERRRLWLACVVGPPGVWARWLLARLNGQGIGPKRHLKWLPIGTLLTNLVASTLEAGLAVVLVVAPDRSALLVKGLQIGLLGCMSTVSTFVVEIYALHQSPHRWRAYAYAGIMLFCTFSVGALVFTLTTLTHHF